MKKLYFILIGFLVFGGVEAQVINFPDANFKAKLITLGLDFNNDGNIDQSEALSKTYLNISSSAISDLTGIAFFTNLNTLNANNNNIATLSPLNGMSNLVILYIDGNVVSSLLGLTGLSNLSLFFCKGNLLTSLDGINSFPNLENLDCGNMPLYNLSAISNLTHLVQLSCQNCQLTTLSNITGLTNLQLLWCGFNPSSILPSINGMTSLRQLSCRGMGISDLNSISGLNNLTFIDVGDNEFYNLNLSNFPNLKELFCSNNNLSSLNLSQVPNLTRLYCDTNHLTNLNVSSLVHLYELGCANNQLTTLNVLGLNQLTSLYCQNNHITSLDFTGLSQLVNLVCSGNNLTTIDVSNQHNLDVFEINDMLTLTTVFMKNGVVAYYGSLGIFNDPNLIYICTDDFLVPLLQDIISYSGYTNCHVNSYCSFTPGGTFYTIQGNNHYDSNNNGCSPTDINFPNLQIEFTDGINTGNLIPDNSGAYHYDIQAGTQTITPTLENPTYFNVSPTTATVTFPTTSSPYTQDFCITASGTHNDLEIALIPISNARPGFDAIYKIIYKNKGTGTQSGAVNLSFDDARLDYVSATPTVSGQATNSLSWNFSNLVPFETREIVVTINVNSPTETPAVNGGDVLNYTTTIVGATDETPTDNTATVAQTVVNSFDPNDKTCTEGTTVSPSMVGKYVHYIIRFENDGTANAQNIVVKDIIDTNKYDISSLVPLCGSASFTTRITNTNQVEFIFQNINLPFTSGTNTGYVAFKIKTKPTLVVGNTFSNTANIYFDYNAPIVTNTASTTIAALANPTFAFSDYFTLSPVPVKDILTITAKQDSFISSISIYNTLGQVVLVTSNPSTTIDVSNLATGSYFIKVLSDKGTSSSKFIKE